MVLARSESGTGRSAGGLRAAGERHPVTVDLVVLPGRQHRHTLGAVGAPMSVALVQPATVNLQNQPHDQAVVADGRPPRTSAAMAIAAVTRDLCRRPDSEVCLPPPGRYSNVGSSTGAGAPRVAAFAARRSGRTGQPWRQSGPPPFVYLVEHDKNAQDVGVSGADTTRVPHFSGWLSAPHVGGLAGSGGGVEAGGDVE